MDLGLEGQVALVTGAASGIGQAIAQALAQEGVRVAVNDISAERCEETLALIRASGGAGLCAAFDVSRLDAVGAGMQDVEAQVGRIDILVNNAAVMIGNVPFVETRPEDCEREIQVSLFGTLHCSRVALKGMIERGHGRLVNIVSDASRVGQENEAAYSCAKGGMISFTKSLAREVGRFGITVNAVSPAATDTPLRRALLERMSGTLGADRVAAREERIRRAYPMRRIGKTSDTAALVSFLVSAQAGYITGQVCSVNGGYAMPG